MTKDMQALMAVVAQLAEQVAALTPATPTDAPVNTTPAKGKKKNTRSTPTTGNGQAGNPKPCTFAAWAIAKHGIPTDVGAKFNYQGKTRTTAFKVTAFDGDKVTAIRV